MTKRQITAAAWIGWLFGALMLAFALWATYGPVTEPPDPSTAVDDDIAAEREELAERVEELETERDELDEELTAADEEIVDLEDALGDTEEELAEAREELEVIEDDIDDEDAASESEPLFTEEGLVDQLRLAAPPSFPGTGEPESTDFYTVDPGDVGATDLSPASSPGEILSQWFAATGATGAWEHTVRVLEEGDRFDVAVLQWGLQDESTLGEDIRLRLEQTGGQWEVSSIEQRLHCARGVDDSTHPAQCH